MSTPGRHQALRAIGRCVCCGKRKAKAGVTRCKICHARALVAQKQKRDKRIAHGLCTCGKSPAVGRRLCRKCQKSATAATKVVQQRYRAAGLCNCGGTPVTGKKSCAACLEGFRRKHQKLRDEVFAAYGGYICKCCGETIPEFLELDHVNNDGGSHRRRLGSNVIYRWLKSHGFPPGYRVLCSNCHFARHRHGRCPHELLRDKMTA
jgi:hypothetical protein